MKTIYTTHTLKYMVIYTIFVTHFWWCYRMVESVKAVKTQEKIQGSIPAPYKKHCFTGLYK